MINLAENGVTCDCGSTRLAPALVPTGEPVICDDCARTFRLDVALTPIPWSQVEAALADRWIDLNAFEWHRDGVPVPLRRTVAELHATGGRFANVDRVGTVAGLLVVCVLVLIVRAVLS